MAKTSVQEYLSEEENLLLKWKGDLTDVANNGVLFGATDRRLIYLNGSSFKDIEYNHISSIESDTEQEFEKWSSFSEQDMKILAGGSIAALLGLLFFSYSDGLGALFAGSGLIGIVSVLVKNAEMGEVQKIKLITGDEEDQQIEFKTKDNIGADLSKIIRDYS